MAEGDAPSVALRRGGGDHDHQDQERVLDGIKNNDDETDDSEISFVLPDDDENDGDDDEEESNDDGQEESASSGRSVVEIVDDLDDFDADGSIERLLRALDDRNIATAKEIVKERVIRFSSLLVLALARNEENAALFCVETWPSGLRRQLQEGDFWWDEITEYDDVWEDGDYPLHMAARVAPAGVLRRMIEACPESLFFRNGEDRIPLMTAFHRRGSHEELYEVFKVLVDAAPATMLHVKDRLGNLPLHYACSRYPVQVVRLIAGKYMKAIRIRDNRGSLPLHCALVGDPEEDTPVESTVETISFLVESYPQSLSIPGIEGLLPLHLAVINRKANIDIIRRLLSLASSPSEMIAARIPKNGATALHLAATNSNAMFKLLSSASPDSLRARDFRGRLPLHYCLDCPEKMKVALEHFPEAASREEADEEGNIPLHLTRNGDVAKILADAYPSGLKHKNNEGVAPVHIAATAALHLLSRKDVLESLLERDPTCLRQKCSRGMSPISHVIEKYDEESGENFMEVLGFLLKMDKGCLKTLDFDKATPIHHLAKNENMESSEAMELLLKSSPEGATSFDLRGNIPLFYAARHGSLDKILLFVQSSVDVFVAEHKINVTSQQRNGDENFGRLRKRQRTKWNYN